MTYSAAHLAAVRDRAASIVHGTAESMAHSGPDTLIIQMHERK